MAATYLPERTRSHLEREVDQAIHRAEANCQALEMRLGEFDAQLTETRRSLTAAGYLFPNPAVVPRPRPVHPRVAATTSKLNADSADHRDPRSGFRHNRYAAFPRRRSPRGTEAVSPS
jgi:hypothetical protein